MNVNLYRIQKVIESNVVNSLCIFCVLGMLDINSKENGCQELSGEAFRSCWNSRKYFSYLLRQNRNTHSKQNDSWYDIYVSEGRWFANLHVFQIIRLKNNSANNGIHSIQFIIWKDPILRSRIELVEQTAIKNRWSAFRYG